MTVQKPLNAEAVRMANEQLWSENPELGGRQLTMTADPQETAYRKDWVKAYQAALKKLGVKPPTSGDGPVGSPSKPCEACQKKADLVVTVTDQDGSALQGATVKLTGPEAHSGVTAADGTVAFRGIKPSPPEYSITASKHGYSTETTKLAVVAGMEQRETLSLRRRRLFFALYYVVDDFAFFRAADTWKNEVTVAHSFQAPQDVFVLKQVKTEADFEAAWNAIAAQSASTGAVVVEGHLFTHASKSPPHDDDGLEFAPAPGEDGTITQSEIVGLTKLDWDKQAGLLTLAGCNTGLQKGRGWAPAEVFAKAQGVATIGQSGYAYFSTNKAKYSEIDDGTHDTVIYLWAYRRGKNGALGDGAKMPGIPYSP